MTKIPLVAFGFAIGAAMGAQFPVPAAAQQLPNVVPPDLLASIAQKIRQADLARAAKGLPQLNPTYNGHTVHIIPTPKAAAKMLANPVPGDPDKRPLLYNGGPIQTNAELYAIFRLPASGTLQNGNPTSMSTNYRDLQKRLLKDWHGHGLANIMTQYFEIKGLTTTYVEVRGSLAGDHLDTSPYPASGCTDTATPGNRITDAQIQTEIQNVMALKGWTGGDNKLFLLYTSQGEGSCDAPNSCAYTEFCGYHSVISGSPNIL